LPICPIIRGKDNVSISACVNLSKIQETKVNKALIVEITIFVVPIVHKKASRIN